MMKKMASSQSVKLHWYPQVLKELMAEKRMTSKMLADHIDRPESLVQSVIDSTHSPSLVLAEQMLHGLGFEFEVVPRERKP